MLLPSSCQALPCGNFGHSNSVWLRRFAVPRRAALMRIMRIMRIMRFVVGAPYALHYPAVTLPVALPSGLSFARAKPDSGKANPRGITRRTHTFGLSGLSGLFGLCKHHAPATRTPPQPSSCPLHYPCGKSAPRAKPHNTSHPGYIAPLLTAYRRCHQTPLARHKKTHPVEGCVISVNGTGGGT